MMLELLLFTFAGIALGVFTGLMPGIHVNTVGLLLLGIGLPVNPYYTAVAIMSMAVTHTIFDFIPSILLGAPDPETALSVLPGHRMLLEGRGLEAVYLTIVGSVGSVLAAVALFPLLLFVIPWFYGNVQGYIHYILALIALVMVMTESGKARKAYATLVFIMSGLLGQILLNSYILTPSMILFPIFTGLFGLSALIISLRAGYSVPKQIRKGFSVPNSTSPK